MVSIVIPALNEADGLASIVEKICSQFASSQERQIIIVDDGSTDETLSVIKKLSKTVENCHYISLSRNFGHQNALKAGIDFATGDCLISIDADGQHPPELIPKMIAHWKQGYEVVYTLRDDSESTQKMKTLSSRMFYRMQNVIGDVKLEYGAADFRLLDKKVVQILRQFKEEHLFWRGIVSWVGFRQLGIKYKPNLRSNGKSKYSILKMFDFATAGITSFSLKPLRFSLYLGLVMAIFSFVYALYAVFGYFVSDNFITGWTSMIVVTLMFGGVMLVFLGVIGEYIGRISMEVKRRPQYIISQTSMKMNKNRDPS